MRRTLFTFGATLWLAACVAAAALWVRSYRTADEFRKPLIESRSGEFRWCVLQAGSTDGRAYLDLEYWHQWGLSSAVHLGPATQREWSAIWRQHRLQLIMVRASLASRSPQTAAASSPSPWKLEWQNWPGQNTNDWTAQLGAPYWAITMTFFSLAIAFWWLRQRNAVKCKNGCCTSCGYSLTGNTSGTCPECGTPVQHDLGAVA